MTVVCEVFCHTNLSSMYSVNTARKSHHTNGVESTAARPVTLAKIGRLDSVFFLKTRNKILLRKFYLSVCKQAAGAHFNVIPVQIHSVEPGKHIR